MSKEIANKVIQYQQQMEADRQTWMAHWTDCARLCLPRADDFNTKRESGAKRMETIYDGTQILANERFAAILESLLTPRTQRWHRLKSPDEELNEDAEVKRYFEEVNNILFSARYSPRANYASQQHEIYVGLGALGTGCLFIDDMIGQGIRYKSIHLSQIFISEDQWGQIDMLYRKWAMTARQWVQKFKEKTPPKIKEAAAKTPEKTFDCIHAVMPNDEPIYGRVDFEGMPFSSIYVACDEQVVVDQGGYNTFPYAVSRYVTATNEIYGRSPAMTALPDIKMLQEMEKTSIRMAHKAIDPPLLLRDDSIMQRFSTKPNALNYGGVNAQGQQMAQPLQTGSNYNIAMDEKDQKRKQINDVFLVTLFQILVEQPQMTATEVLERAQEKGALLSPTMGRQQSEALGPMIVRELDILNRAGVLPQPPDVLIERGGDFKIEYESPLSRAQRSEDLLGIQRTLALVQPYAERDPTIMDRFNFDEIIDVAADVNGMPQKTLRTDEETQALRQGRAQQQEAAAAAEAAPKATKALKDVAEIQNMGANG